MVDMEDFLILYKGRDQSFRGAEHPMIPNLPPFLDYPSPQPGVQLVSSSVMIHIQTVAPWLQYQHIPMAQQLASLAPIQTVDSG